MTKRIQSPSQTVGPFFHYGLLFGGENILVNEQTKGQRILITGTVYDGDAKPIPDALLEIWQADAAGIYAHLADPRHAEADLNFKGFGRADTLKGGVYTFKTVKPGAKDSVPYVNVRVFSRGMLIHAVTRLYFSDEDNANDEVLKSVSDTRRQTLIATLEHKGDLATYRFDIHLQGPKETVFFDL
jgi:protocatechuate 3,4-dioxygenase alpha subunit